MDHNPDSSRKRRHVSRKFRNVGLVGSWVTIVTGGVSVILPLFGVEVSRWTLLVVAAITSIALVLYIFFRPDASVAFFRYVSIATIRLKFTLLGSSTRNLFGDLVGILGLAGLAFCALHLYRGYPFSVHYRFIFFSSVICLLYHALIHPMVKARPWESDYKVRKLNLAVALNDIGICLPMEKATHHRVASMEQNALSAIKSYLEFTVSDKGRSNLNVNLIVKDPTDEKTLVCIQRAVKGRPVPSRYGEDELKKARVALETGQVHYNGRYFREGKDYRMIWVVPIPSPENKEQNLGLLAVDSRKRRHLDMRDHREALQKNLSPYIAVLAVSLLLRTKHKIWDELQ